MNITEDLYELEDNVNALSREIRDVLGSGKPLDFQVLVGLTERIHELVLRLSVASSGAAERAVVKGRIEDILGRLGYSPIIVDRSGLGVIEEDLQNLQVGDVVRHKLHDVTFIVTARYGRRATAVCTVDITNPDEWVLVRKIRPT